MSYEEFADFLTIIKNHIDTTTELSGEFESVTETDWKDAIWTDNVVTEISGIVEDKLTELEAINKSSKG